MTPNPPLAFFGCSWALSCCAAGFDGDETLGVGRRRGASSCLGSGSDSDAVASSAAAVGG